MLLLFCSSVFDMWSIQQTQKHTWYISKIKATKFNKNATWPECCSFSLGLTACVLVLRFAKHEPLITDVRSDVSDLSGALRLGLISLSTHHLSVSDWMPRVAAMTDIKGGAETTCQPTNGHWPSAFSSPVRSVSGASQWAIVMDWNEGGAHKGFNMNLHVWTFWVGFC